MKLSTHNTFLPSTQRATKWASETLAILKPHHPLSEPAALFKALKSTQLDVLISQLKEEAEPPRSLIRDLEGLLQHIDVETARPVEVMCAFRHCCLVTGDDLMKRSIDRWFYRSGFHSIRSIWQLDEGQRVKQVAHSNRGSFLLTETGDVCVLNRQTLVPIADFESLDAQQICAFGDTLYVLDEQGIVWADSGVKPKRYGQWPKVKTILATPRGPLIRMVDHLQFQNRILPILSTHQMVSDGEFLLFNQAGLCGYRLDDGSEMSLLSDPKNADEKMMAEAIDDMATTEAGLAFLLHLRFWTLGISRTYRFLQQVGDVLYVSPSGDYAVSLDENLLLAWEIRDGTLVPIAEVEITDSWSVSDVYPIHPEHKAVILHTTAGVMAVDFEHELEVRLLIQPAFAIRIFSIGQAYRFAMSTGQDLHLCRFDRQGLYHG